MLQRKIQARIEEWRRTRTNQGLLITGARQVGKTSSVRDFANSHYDDVVTIDFVERPQAIDVVKGARDLDDLLMRITALSDKPIVPGSTLLFFDEVQRCGDAITWMRYLGSDPRFEVIYSGSLLGVEAYDFRQFPVGTLDVVEMFPLDFEEFSWAWGVVPALWDVVRQCHDELSPVPDYLHDRLISLYERYVLVGGMPEAVASYVETKDTQLMRSRQRAILDTYRRDVTRYESSHEKRRAIKAIYDAVPAELDKENRRFAVGALDKNARFERLRADFDWLEDAGVVIPVVKTTEARFPLEFTSKRSFFKLYMNDVGLLFSTFGAAEVEDILLDQNRLNLGRAYENAVAQELRAAGRSHLYYYNQRSVGEVDFVVDAADHKPFALPIEVKSGSRSSSHNALDRLLSLDNYEAPRAVVLHKGNVEVHGKVIYLPLYMAGLV